MSQSLHSCALAEKVSHSTLRLYFEHFYSYYCFSPKTFVNDTISTFRYLTLENQLLEINLKITIECTWLNS